MAKQRSEAFALVFVRKTRYLCLMPCRSRGLSFLACSLLCTFGFFESSCSSGGRRVLEWEIELGIGIDLERAAFLEVELLEGGCGAGARAVHLWGFGRGEGRNRMEMPRDVRAG
ncbi:MAG: hypothetical protein N2515_11625, partial [Deltaproteobacteria bacterium]|nr:hypothetical protein [Deltaproteobacteria bacterium]